MGVVLGEQIIRSGNKGQLDRRRQHCAIKSVYLVPRCEEPSVTKTESHEGPNQVVDLSHQGEIRYSPTNNSCQAMSKDIHADPGVLIAHILSNIPGSKILTLVTNQGAVAFDMGPGNEIGYARNHRDMLLSTMMNGIKHGGGLMLRQFLSVKSERTMPNGKKLWIPEKNVYGASLGQEVWELLDGRNTREAHNTDSQTGEPLEKDPGVHFPNWPAIVELTSLEKFPRCWRAN